MEGMTIESKETNSNSFSYPFFLGTWHKKNSERSLKLSPFFSLSFFFRPRLFSCPLSFHKSPLFFSFFSSPLQLLRKTPHLNEAFNSFFFLFFFFPPHTVLSFSICQDREGLRRQDFHRLRCGTATKLSQVMSQGTRRGEWEGERLAVHLKHNFKLFFPLSFI